MIEVEKKTWARFIILSSIVATSFYAMYLGMENIALAALGIVGGYLTKNIEYNIKELNINNQEESDQ
jgi:hypothetical protein